MGAPGAFIAARRRVIGDPRTLYGKGGGIFGLAKLADALMDAWMTDPTLNANAKVARWHHSAQKCGFKFLVTQIMGYLTGGPQRYTGKPMDVAHKHLGITGMQWDSFMTDADRVFADFKIAPGTQRELRAILASFRQQCTLSPGEVAPSDPGNTPPSGSSLYAALGGVYPIAQFVDRLVDVVLTGDSLQAPLKVVHGAHSERHPAGLKYMVTELVCNGTGGPEIVTSRGFDDAKLGIDEHEWPAFLSLAEKAADIWSDMSLKGALMTVLGELKEEICIGVFTTRN